MEKLKNQFEEESKELEEKIVNLKKYFQSTEKVTRIADQLKRFVPISYFVRNTEMQ